MQHVDPAILKKSIGYVEYHALIEEILSQNHYLALKSIENDIHDTRLNLIRMERLDKTARMTAQTRLQMAAIQTPLIWLTITEVWCGDAAQIVPTIQKMAALNANVEHRLVFRDQHPELMDAFLTKGTRSIPLTIVLSKESLKVLGHWGPRPQELQAFVLENLQILNQIKDEQEYKMYNAEFLTKVQRWYAKDKTYSTQKEFLDVLKKANA
ncbi:thioredoxin family protein [Haliscomenobacter sp.]|uniref:thioredoxin family protein n=1 Tax=Haliscomenobacter sp. TaxID=2717303 RepID=UPI003BA88509